MNRTTMPQTESKQKERSTVVCVTNHLSCERLIRAGRLIADLSKTPLLVINVSSPDLSEQDAKALEYLFTVSKDNGAQMTVLYENDPMTHLTRFIKEHRAANVVTGMAGQTRSPLPDLWRQLQNIQFFTVTEDGSFSHPETTA